MPSASSHKLVPIASVIADSAPATARSTEQILNQRRKDLIKNLEVCDLLDIRNPQSVSEYASDIFNNMMKEEMDFVVKKDFWKKHSELKEKTRSYVVEWIIEVASKFRLWTETTFVTINYIDRYLENTTRQVSKKDLQTMAIASLLIGCKYEEIYPPECRDMIKVSGDHSISKSAVLKFEYDILQVLDFNMQPHTANRFLERMVKLTNAEEKVH